MSEKEIAAVREAQRRGLPVIGIVDTNSDPTDIDYVIPANDDAVGSVSFIIHYMAEAYKEGKELHEKDQEEKKLKESVAVIPEAKPAEEKPKKTKTTKTKKA